MKGIVLAGGSGTRLWPITLGVSKQLLPVHNKPLIYYPIGTLMLAGIRDFLVITTPIDQLNFIRLLGDGSQWGININFAIQTEPRGLAEAFILGEDFIGNEHVALALGDNIFHGTGLGLQLRQLVNKAGAEIFGYKVSDPSNYGVAEINHDGSVLALSEKPANPKSNIAIPGLYFYDNDVVPISKQVKPSERGELEIISVNQIYLEAGKLHLNLLERGTAWLDTGTFESLASAPAYVKIIEQRQGNMICCLEEIAWRNGWLSQQSLLNLSEKYSKTEYGSYLKELARL